MRQGHTADIQIVGFIELRKLHCSISETGYEDEKAPYRVCCLLIKTTLHFRCRARSGAVI
jgi:hypothetical protein